MMTTYPHHPGGLQQPGIPHGHPMGPGPGPNPGQPMTQGMMHPGVSGPNGPHVSQPGPMMGGMQPGMGPSAHALSHLAPQAHMFQQQQQQQNMQNMQMNNPALFQQRNAQHQAFLQQQRAMMAQQGNMAGMGFPNQMNQGMTPQQMAAMQAAGANPGQLSAVPLPAHLQRQLQQQQAMQQQQQQAAHNAQLQAQAAQQQQQQQQQQHQHQQQQLQSIAMQQAASQSSNPSQPGNQGPPTTTQPPQGPLRPPSQMGAREGQPSPAPPQNTQQGPPQQTPQPQTTQAPTPQQTAPQQPPQQHPQQNPQQMQQAQQQQRQMLHNQAAMMQARQAQQAQQGLQNGHIILKLLNFSNVLGKFNATRQLNTIEHWQGFVAKFFTEEGSFKHTLLEAGDRSMKQFEVVYPALPRYFLTQFDSGLESIQITLDETTEKTIGSGYHSVSCQKSKFIYWFKNGIQVICSGKLTAMFGTDEKMDLLSFEMQDHQSYLPRQQLERLFSQPSPSQLSNTQSPRMNKQSAKQRAQQQRLQKPEIPPEPSMNLSELPASPICSYGVTENLLRYLEVSETMANMRDLMVFYQQNPSLNPAQAVTQFVTNLQPVQGQLPQQPTPNQQQGGNLPPNPQQLLQGQQGMQQHNMPPGVRTPNNPGQPGAPPNHQFMSPAMQNQLLPNAINGSPHLMQQTHTPSPAQTHGMIPQRSQQGTNNSAGVSANTSPNVSNKRRRSTVKVEDGDGGGDVNGTGGAQKVKQSPRPGTNKRVKASNN